ncbi:hypothetical protein BGZ72_000916 [Mortierella alpina]|nr:hypothetical protein BGZ72_000916 [Mortierella alpina]
MVNPINTDPVALINTDHDCSTSQISTEYDARGPQAQAAEGLSQEMIETILKTHNEYRKKHGAQNLVWNSTAAAYGKKWIERCKFEHSGGLFGENLAMGYKNFEEAIKAWYNEGEAYKYKNPGFDGKTGTYNP